MNGKNQLCRNCFLKTFSGLCEKFNIDKNTTESFFQFFEIHYNANAHLTTPEIQRGLNREFCRLINIKDPFEREKFDNNQHALALYNLWKIRLHDEPDIFNTTLKLAIAGNIIDYGANNTFDINETIDRVMTSDFAINHSALLMKKLKTANKILYLGDNAGEIVFDKLFAEYNLQYKDIVFAVKSAPVLNDVTIDDALQTGMDTVARIISNGFDAPSTILNQCSDEFLHEFHTADLIISKGQGNFEGLSQLNNPKIFFLLMAKCHVIANALNVEKGSFIVMNMQTVHQ